ncbi:hypothetical protein [Paenibacillus sp.]|uniref:hypothetical protein n=1 Tax=Paenibacillus sp. TaxID=58172 RepID=UPI002D766D27|nr:hypothetical protein [Paenibacillus sp.]
MELRNERGGAALLYILMIALVLAVVTPAVLATTSNESLRGKTDGHSLLATNLSVSAMETFLAYLYTYEEEQDGTDPVAFINAYPGMGTTSYETPEGTPVTVELAMTGPNEGAYTAVVSVQAGAAPAKRTKTVAYTLVPPTSSTSAPVPNEEGRYEVPENSTGIYVDSDQNANGVDPTVVNRSISTLETIIGGIIDESEAEFADELTAYAQAAHECTCATVDEILTAYNVYDDFAGPTSPVVIKSTAAAVTIDKNFTFGTSGAPMILVAKDINSSRNSANLTLNGSLYLTEDLSFSGNNSTLTVNSVGGNYGDLIVQGVLYAQNTLVIDADGDVFAGSLDFDNTATVTADSLTVTGHFDVLNNTTLNITKDIAVGSMTVNNNTVLTVTAGDFLVEGDFAGGSNNTISTGGVIAAGGDFSIATGSTLETGGGSTSLYEVADTFDGDVDPEPTPGTGWAIDRKG